MKWKPRSFTLTNEIVWRYCFQQIFKTSKSDIFKQFHDLDQAWITKFLDNSHFKTSKTPWRQYGLNIRGTFNYIIKTTLKQPFWQISLSFKRFIFLPARFFGSAQVIFSKSNTLALFTALGSRKNHTIEQSHIKGLPLSFLQLISI